VWGHVGLLLDVATIHGRMIVREPGKSDQGGAGRGQDFAAP
jgi:hypothetical protein